MSYNQRTDWTDDDKTKPVMAADLLRIEKGIGDLYRQRQGRSSAMALGDSLSASVAAHLAALKVDSHMGVTNGHSSADWLFQANLLADSPLDVLGSAATAGYTVEQIRDVHLPVVLATRPTYCFCWSLGANNALASGQFPKSMLDVSLSILDRLEAEGITPILFTLPPVNGGGDMSWDESDRYNSWVAYIAQTRGYPFVDLHAVLVDSANGGYKAGLSDDALHPNGLGSAVIAAEVSKLITKLDRTGTRAHLLDVNLQDGGSPGTSPNPHLASTNGTSPDGWILQGGNATFAAQGNGRPGNLMTLTRSGGTDVNAYGPSLACSPGEVWSLALRLGAAPGATGAWVVGVLDDSGNPLAFAYQQRMAVPNTRILNWRGIVPAGRTTMRPFLSIGGADGATVSAAQVTFRNLSRKQIPL